MNFQKSPHYLPKVKVRIQLTAGTAEAAGPLTLNGNAPKKWQGSPSKMSVLPAKIGMDVMAV